MDDKEQFDVGFSLSCFLLFGNPYYPDSCELKDPQKAKRRFKENSTFKERKSSLRIHKLKQRLSSLREQTQCALRIARAR